MNRVLISVDFFGAAGAPLIAALTNQSTNNRARRVAFNNLVRLAKSCALVAKNSEVKEIAIAVNEGGVIELTFMYGFKAVSAPESSPFPKPQTKQQMSLNVRDAVKGENL